MNLTQSAVGKMAATYDQPIHAQDEPPIRSVGRIVGYFTEPVVIIDYGSGLREAWSARLTEIDHDHVQRVPAKLAHDGFTVGETRRLTSAALAEAMRDVPKAAVGETIPWDAFARAVLDLLNKPPRIPEPTGKYAVVEASTTGDRKRCPYVSDGRGYWDPVGDAAVATTEWKFMVDPVLVREGLDG